MRLKNCRDFRTRKVRRTFFKKKTKRVLGDQTNESRNSWFNSFMELIQKPKADQVLLLPQARKNSEQIKLALVNDVDVRYMHARDLFRKCFFSKAIDEISE
jgi:hypothetical protein